MEKKKRQREHFCHFCLAGFTYYDGVLAFDQLKIGQQLELIPEPTNPVDRYAVMIYLDEYKLGYVPRVCNRELSKLLNAGHNVFSAFVQMVDERNHPEEQVKVVVFIENKLTQ